MDSRAHVIIAVIAAFAVGEASVILAVLRRRRPLRPAPPGARQQPEDGQVIPLARDRIRRHDGRRAERAS